MDIISEKDKELIWQMFFGPYIEEWRDKNGIIDNTDETIAKRLRLNKANVGNYIYRRLNKHFNNI